MNQHKILYSDIKNTYQGQIQEIVNLFPIKKGMIKKKSPRSRRKIVNEYTRESVMIVFRYKVIRQSSCAREMGGGREGENFKNKLKPSPADKINSMWSLNIKLV